MQELYTGCSVAPLPRAWQLVEKLRGGSHLWLQKADGTHEAITLSRMLGRKSGHAEALASIHFEGMAGCVSSIGVIRHMIDEVIRLQGLIDHGAIMFEECPRQDPKLLWIR